LRGEVEAADRNAAATRPEISFGLFRLLPAQRFLSKDDSPVRLGNRTLDLLIALTEWPGALLGKQELIAKVWPDVFVAEDNLKVHIAALRRALADGEAGNRYIATVTGWGYCFVAPVARDLCAAFEHSVWFIDLTAIGDPLSVPAALASAIPPARPLMRRRHSAMRTPPASLPNCRAASITTFGWSSHISADR
jgi:DNA-binding winged helix-turn-helix (wHTH) protein